MSGFKMPNSISTPYGKVVSLGQNQNIIFKEPATLEEAKSVGQILQKVGFINPRDKVTVQLQKRDSIYVVRIVVNQEFLNKPNEEKQPVFKEFAHIAHTISAEGMKGESVLIELCDSNLKMVESITMKKKEN